MCGVDGDHLSGQLTLNPALIIAVLGKRLLLGQDEVERDRLLACVVEVLGASLRLALDRIDVRKVGFSATLCGARSAGPIDFRSCQVTPSQNPGYFYQIRWFSSSFSLYSPICQSLNA